MAHLLFILSKEFLSKEELIPKIESIANKQSAEFSPLTEYRGFSKISIWKSEDYSLEIHFQTRKKFDELKKDNYWGQDYGPIFSITVYGKDREEDEVTFPFVREFLVEYPDMLVFNEEVPDGGKPFIFTKAHIDALSSNNFAAIFAHPYSP